jgi:hypothetical protein
MYSVFKLLENGEFLKVVSLEELEQAVQIVQGSTPTGPENML